MSLLPGNKLVCVQVMYEFCFILKQGETYFGLEMYGPRCAGHVGGKTDLYSRPPRVNFLLCNNNTMSEHSQMVL